MIPVRSKLHFPLPAAPLPQQPMLSKLENAAQLPLHSMNVAGTGVGGPVVGTGVGTRVEPSQKHKSAGQNGVA
jgi:hypothetical protein